jgi:alpha,alpha-trehalose phosphorylase
MRVDVTQRDITFTIEEGTAVTVHVHHEKVEVAAGASVTVELSNQGPRLETAPPTTSDLRGMLRADGSVVTASIPTVSLDRSEVDADVAT